MEENDNNIDYDGLIESPNRLEQINQPNIQMPLTLHQQPNLQMRQLPVNSPQPPKPPQQTTFQYSSIDNQIKQPLQFQQQHQIKYSPPRINSIPYDKFERPQQQKYYIVKNCDKKFIETLQDKNILLIKRCFFERIEQNLNFVQVYMIFSNITTRQFYGYARMTTKPEDIRQIIGNFDNSGEASYYEQFQLYSKVEWQTKNAVNFEHFKDIKNAWNNNNVVNYSKECQELEPSAAQQVIDLLENPPVQVRPDFPPSLVIPTTTPLPPSMQPLPPMILPSEVGKQPSVLPSKPMLPQMNNMMMMYQYMQQMQQMMVMGTTMSQWMQQSKGSNAQQMMSNPNIQAMMIQQLMQTNPQLAAQFKQMIAMQKQESSSSSSSSSINSSSSKEKKKQPKKKEVSSSQSIKKKKNASEEIDFKNITKFSDDKDKEFKPQQKTVHDEQIEEPLYSSSSESAKQRSQQSSSHEDVTDWGVTKKSVVKKKKNKKVSPPDRNFQRIKRYRRSRSRSQSKERYYNRIKHQYKDKDKNRHQKIRDRSDYELKEKIKERKKSKRQVSKSKSVVHKKKKKNSPKKSRSISVSSLSKRRLIRPEEVPYIEPKIEMQETVSTFVNTAIKNKLIISKEPQRKKLVIKQGNQSLEQIDIQDEQPLKQISLKKQNKPSIIDRIIKKKYSN